MLYPAYMNPDVNDRDEQVIDETPVLSLPIDDNDLLSVMRDKIEASEKYYKSKKLEQKRKQNEEFYLGDQMDEESMYDYQKPAYKNNMIWEDLERQCTTASNKLPDIICTGLDRDGVKSLQDELERRITNDAGKRVIKDGLRQRAINYLAAVKFRWDSNKGEKGDFVYELCDIKSMLIDHTAKIPQDGFTADNMDFIGEWIEEPLSLVFTKFPDKKSELMQIFNYKQMTAKRYATKIKYLEFWFTWYSPDGTIMEGVAWRYKNLILGKNKNPNWDYDGYDHPFLKPADKIHPEKVETETKHVYNNFFERPRKPYIFFSFRNLGKDPMDDTTAVEQSIPMQKIVNKRGRQITEIADATVPKQVFGNGITKEDAANVTHDPSESLWFNTEDVSKAYGSIAGSPPSPMLLEDLNASTQVIDSKFATHQASKGELNAVHMSGLARQLMMQGDITMADSIVMTVVNRVILEMAMWAVQMMKVYYDEDHYSRTMGDDGQMVEKIINNGMITDGVLVHIKANTTDQASKKQDAQDLFKAQAIDPLTLYEDMDVSNPKERVKRLLAWLKGQGPQGDGFATYEQEIGIVDNSQQNSSEAQLGQPSDTTNPQQETPVNENVPTT